MKSRKQTLKQQAASRREFLAQLSRTEQADRSGSTLMIVLALLSLLAFTGMVFYTMASQEAASADYFSESAKNIVTVQDDPFPWALRQLIVGPDRFQDASMLSRRHSLVSGVVGFDTVPHTGKGVNIVYDGGLPVSDQNYDLSGDYPPTGPSGTIQILDPINFVDAPGAWLGANGANPGQVRDRVARMPEPDVDHTYPDINNVWLGYDGFGIRDLGPGAGPVANRYQEVRVTIPSYMRPGLMKSSNANGFNNNSSPMDADWYDHANHPEYAVRSMRPSVLHVGGFSNVDDSPIPRFVHHTSAADAAIRSRIGHFEFAPTAGSDFGKLGPLTGHSENEFELDVDGDNDGRKEGIWKDLAYPVQELEDGTLYSVLHSITVKDLGGNLDLNAAGNLSRMARRSTVPQHLSGAGIGGQSTATMSLSASNQALGPHEVSLTYALQPEASKIGGLSFYGGPADANRLEYANMQLMYLLWGRVDGTDIYDGRWGDPDALQRASQTGWAVNRMPRPGQPGTYAPFGSPLSPDNRQFGGLDGHDDNRDATYGVRSIARLRGVMHPIDGGGTGRAHMAADPRLPNRTNPLSPTRPDMYQAYEGYDVVIDDNGNLLNESKYIGGFDGDLSTTGDNLIANVFYNMGMDDPLETLYDHEYDNLLGDRVFAIDATAFLQLPNSSDRDKVSDRLYQLTEENAGIFGDDEARSRFTTFTNNLRGVKNAYPDAGSPRLWEWNDQDGDGREDFPPQFGVPAYSQDDPFRPEVRVLLRASYREPTELISQLPLSINHILDVNRAGGTPAIGTPAYLAYIQRAGLRFRGLTEHPRATDIDQASGLTFAELIDGSGGITNTIPVNDGMTGGDDDVALQSLGSPLLRYREFWARRDRQKLARDIYVLLYTFGGGLDTVNTANGKNPTLSNAPVSGVRSIYSDNELRRMAQFAVNMVDAMDADDVVTKFEYDKNLADGWNLDDDPYSDVETVSSAAGTDSGMYPLDDGDRGVVMGVEAQQLSFSESLAVRFEDFGKYDGALDDPTTIHNDAQTAAPLANEETDRRDRYLLHLELQNNQPYAVPLSVNGITGTTEAEHAIWQLARVDRESAGGAGAGNPSLAVQAATLNPIDSPSGATADGTTMSFMDGNVDIQGGGRFSIAMASVANAAVSDPLRSDPLATGTADLYLSTGAASFELISPNDPSVPAVMAGGGLTPHSNLDTIHTSHDGRYAYDENNTDKGHFLRDIPYATAGATAYHGNQKFGFNPAENSLEANEDSGQGFEVVLRRRANPNLPQQSLAHNPWVEVDRIRVEFKDYFEIMDIGGGMHTATPHLDELKSEERSNPLDATVVTLNDPMPAPGDQRYNSIAFSSDPLSGINDATTTTNATARFEIWQPHYDREFTSVIELFNLPVVGPKLLTNRLNRMRYSPAQQALVDPLSGVTDGMGNFRQGDPDLVGSASAIFLQPDFHTANPPGNPDPNDNAWYRLLNFVEVPSRVNVMLGDYFGRLRLPGKVNLNGISHKEVYAGLLDEPAEADISYTYGGDATNEFAPFTHPAVAAVAALSPEPLQDIGTRPVADTGTTAALDASGTAVQVVAPLPGPIAVRDRWFEFLAERDGPTLMWDQDNMQNTTFWIPGTPNARPFRSIGNPWKPEDSVLRPLAMDALDTNQETNRHWQELGSEQDHANPPVNVGPGVSQHQRHYLLQKVLNNSTTTSNTFVVYITVGYFRSEEVEGVIRIGERMGLDTDGDGNEQNDPGWGRRAMFLIDRSELINAWDEGSGTFDWERLVKFRVDLDIN